MIILFNIKSFFVVRVHSQTCSAVSAYDSCSTNTDCGCLPMVISDNRGLCGFLWVSCSRLDPCQAPNDNCEKPGHICVQHPRCNDHPVCYPLSMIDQHICPPSKSKETKMNNFPMNFIDLH